MLDVDNWLREYPRESNPTAANLRPLHFTASLLAGWRSQESDQAGYDALVIIAHSQGTVITVDLLRFFTAQGWASPLPIRLFTMGSPLPSALFPAASPTSTSGPGAKTKAPAAACPTRQCSASANG